MAKPSEKAILIVAGLRFEDWESVLVSHEERVFPPYRFRFTCSEGAPLAANWAKLQIKPGDSCQIILAGILAFNGYVLTRQVYYDADRHHIELQGATNAFDAARYAAITPSMEFKNVTLEQFSRKLLNNINVPLTIEGTLAKHIFKRVSITPTETVYDIIERHARVANVAITSNVNGDFVMRAPDSSGNGFDTVIEGVNILTGREVIDNQQVIENVPQIGQLPGDNQTHGAKSAHKPFFNEKLSNIFGAGTHSSITLMEIPVWSQAILQGRGKTESTFTQNESIYVTVTVHGWLRPSGGLWKQGQQVHVKSPMLIMDQTLWLRRVTFTQDNRGGTISTLDLVNDKARAANIPQLSTIAIQPSNI